MFKIKNKEVENELDHEFQHLVEAIEAEKQEFKAKITLENQIQQIFIRKLMAIHDLAELN